MINVKKCGQGVVIPTAMQLAFMAAVKPEDEGNRIVYRLEHKLTPSRKMYICGSPDKAEFYLQMYKMQGWKEVE